MPPPSPASAAAAGPQLGELLPGVSFFQVLEPSPIRGPQGEMQYAMRGPFLELSAASEASVNKPGSLICVFLVLHQQSGRPIVAAAK